MNKTQQVLPRIGDRVFVLPLTALFMEPVTTRKLKQFSDIMGDCENIIFPAPVISEPITWIRKEGRIDTDNAFYNKGEWFFSPHEAEMAVKKIIDTYADYLLWCQSKQK